MLVLCRSHWSSPPPDSRWSRCRSCRRAANSQLTPIASARTLADAPEWVSNPSGTDCGDVELEADGALPGESLRCLQDASEAGEVASLQWVRWTTEGDPTPSFVRTGGAGATVASTAAYDTYGQGGWSECGCADIAALPRCSDVGE